MTEQEQVALETYFISSIGWSPLRPGDWLKQVNRLRKHHEDNVLAEKLQLTIEEFNQRLNRSLLEEYDAFDVGVGKCIEFNKGHFLPIRVLEILEVDILRYESEYLVTYSPLSWNGHLRLGRRTYTVVKSEDDNFRESLARSGYRYHTAINRQ